MDAGEDLARYNRTARTLHWIIAALVIANLATGLLHDPLEKILRLMPFHKASGMTVLVLSLVRIGWRLTWRRPPYPAHMAPAAILAARGVQAVFYALMLIMPLTGWIIASAGKYPLDWFGLFDLPKLAVVKEGPLYAFGHEAHEILGWIFLGLVLLHVAAALRHQFLLGEPILRRML